MADYTPEEITTITQALASLEAIGINPDVQKEMDKLDKEITYRRFYFPGCDTRLRIEGEGTDDAYKTYKTATRVSFDPRYIQNYIELCKEKGFYKWMLWFDPEDNDKLKQLDFEMAFNNFKRYYEGNGHVKSEYIDNKKAIETVASTYASLKYFDKLSCFNLYVNEVDGVDFTVGKINTKKWNVFESNYAEVINEYVTKLTNKIGQTLTEFKTNDIGYFAPSSLAFGITDDMIQTYQRYETEYKEYKEKLWNVLEKVNALQICVNKDNSINEIANGGELNVTQMNNCVQTISNIVTDAEPDTGSKSPTPSGTPGVPISSASMTDYLPQISKIQSELTRHLKYIKIEFVIICVVVLMFVVVTILYCFKLRSSKRYGSYTMPYIIERH